MRWITKPVAWEMSNDNTIIADFKMKMAMILRGNEIIKNLRFMLALMVKNFEPKIRKKIRDISKAILIYDLKQLAKAEQERNTIKGEKVNMVVRWGLNLAATRIFGTVKH